MDTPMDKLATTDNHPFIIDTMDATTLANLQQSSQDRNDMDVNENALIGANPGYADTQNTEDGTGSDYDTTAILDSENHYSTTQLEQDYNAIDTNNKEIDTSDMNLATTDMESNIEQQEHGHIDDYEQQQVDHTIGTSLEKANHSEDHNETSDLQQDDVDDSGKDTETQPGKEDEGEPMEQGTVEEEEVDSNDKLGSTLDEALEALVENDDEQATTTSPLIGSNNSDDLSLLGYHAPSLQHNTTSTTTTTTNTTIGYEGMDELAMIDFSWWLYGAIFVLICLRLPYVKRYFTNRSNRQDADSHATLPYHTIQNKELD